MGLVLAIIFSGCKKLHIKSLKKAIIMHIIFCDPIENCLVSWIFNLRRDLILLSKGPTVEHTGKKTDPKDTIIGHVLQTRAGYPGDFIA